MSPSAPERPYITAMTGRRRPSTDIGAGVYSPALLSLPSRVESPVGADHAPRYDALFAACRTVAESVPPGALVVVESTVSPGTCARIRELFSDGVLFGHCPERVMPGRLLLNLRTYPRVLGAS